MVRPATTTEATISIPVRNRNKGFAPVALERRPWKVYRKIARIITKESALSILTNTIFFQGDMGHLGPFSVREARYQINPSFSSVSAEASSLAASVRLAQ